MLIRRQPKSAHFYTKDGKPFHFVPKLDGSGLRPTTVRDAFKAGAYRSVTNVLGVLAKPGLDHWKQEQVILAALTLPRLPDETDHAFAERVIVDSETQTKEAAKAGTHLHELCEGWLRTGEVPAPPEQVALIKPFQDWCNANLFPDDGLMAPPESCVLNHQHGYAGCIDIPARMRDGSAALLDIKTQDVGLDTKGLPDPGFYPEYALQLAAYSRGIFADGSFAAPFPWRLISLVVDRTRPGCYVHEWTVAEHPIVSSEHHFQAFLAAAKIWSYQKKGTPGIDLKKAA